VLDQPMSATLGRSAGVVTITDDDPSSTSLTIGVGDVSVVEGASGTSRVVRVPVTLSAPVNRTVTALIYSESINASVGGATRDADLVLTTVTFAPNQTTAYVNVTVYGDGAVEPVEGIRVRALVVGIPFSQGSGVLRILDDDAR